MVKKRVKRVSPRSASAKKRLSIPPFVKVISVLYYVLAVVSVLVGLTLFIGGVTGGEIIERVGVDQFLEYNQDTNALDGYFIPILMGALVLGGLLFAALGVLEFYMAKGLWRGENWARIMVIIFSAIGFVSALPEFEVFSLIISGLIGGYLWFDKRVKLVFR